MPWKYFVLALPTFERWRMNFLCATHFVNWQKAKSLAAWEINIANTFQRDWYAELLMQIYKICCHRLFRTFLISFIWLFCCASGILFTPAVHKNINEPKFRLANMKGESKNKKFHHPSQKTRRWSWLPKKKGSPLLVGPKGAKSLAKTGPRPCQQGEARIFGNEWQPPAYGPCFVFCQLAWVAAAASASAVAAAAAAVFPPLALPGQLPRAHEFPSKQEHIPTCPAIPYGLPVRCVCVYVCFLGQVVIISKWPTLHVVMFAIPYKYTLLIYDLWKLLRNLFCRGIWKPFERLKWNGFLSSLLSKRRRWHHSRRVQSSTLG